MKLRFPPRIEVEISSRNFWVKVVEFLQQNWAIIVPDDETGVTVHFVDDVSGVFDRLSFPSLKTAEAALRRNGFDRYSEKPELQSFLRPPAPPFHEAEHPSGSIYSSGRFWR